MTKMFTNRGSHSFFSLEEGSAFPNIMVLVPLVIALSFNTIVVLIMKKKLKK